MTQATRTYSKCIFILALCLMLGSCAKYKVESDGVYYSDWNEARGSASTRLEGADPQTFEVLDFETYAKDQKLVFYKGGLVAGADAPSFKALGEWYAADKNQAYYGGSSIQGSSSKGFRIINDYYSISNSDVYYTTYGLHTANPADFHLLGTPGISGECWADDGRYYYYGQYKVPSEHHSAIVLLGSSGIAKDQQWVYFCGHKINVNDSARQIIDTVDAASFSVKNFLDCRDKFGCINPYQGREACN